MLQFHVLIPASEVAGLFVFKGRIMSGVDHYSHYLAIYDTEKSQRDGSKNLFLTGQVGVATAALIFYQSNPGLLVFFALLSFLMAQQWMENSKDHSQRLAFIVWAIMRYEADGTLVNSTMTALHSLCKERDRVQGIYYDGNNLRQDSAYVKLYKKYRFGDWTIFGAVCFMWFVMVDLAISGSESNYLGGWLIHIFGAGG